MDTSAIVNNYFKAKASETQRLYRRGIDLFHIHVIKDIPIENVTDEHFKKFCQWLSSQKLKPTSQHSYAKGARRFLYYLSRNRISDIRTDVLLEIEKENIKKIGERKYKLPKGIRDFANEYHNQPAPPRKTRKVYLEFLRDRAFIGVLESSGTRITAAIESRVINISWDTSPVKISVIGKGDREHTLRIGNRQARYLKQWLSERGVANDYIFPAMRGKGHMSDETGRNILRRWIRKVLGGDYDFTPHGFRHKVISDWRDKHGLEMAQQLIEHKSISTTEHYPDARTEAELDKAYNH